jgi:hypothetical protein
LLIILAKLATADLVEITIGGSMILNARLVGKLAEFLDRIAPEGWIGKLSYDVFHHYSSQDVE